MKEIASYEMKEINSESRIKELTKEKEKFEQDLVKRKEKLE